MKNVKNALFALCFVPFLTVPAFAGSVNVGSNPMVVAEDVDIGVGGVRIDGGDRNRHRDHDVVIERDRPHHDHDHDRDQDRR